VLGEGDPTVEVDLEGLGLDVGRRDVRIDARIHPHRAHGHPRLAGELGHRLVQHLHVQLEAERRDVTGLLRAEQVTGAADLEVAHRDLEPRRPSSVWSASVASRARASGVSSVASG
jgi:hypothetical protein